MTENEKTAIIVGLGEILWDVLPDYRDIKVVLGRTLDMLTQ